MFFYTDIRRSSRNITHRVQIAVRLDLVAIGRWFGLISDLSLLAAWLTERRRTHLRFA